MRDLSKFIGGQCEIQSHLSEQDNRRTYKGDIKSIKVADTELEIHFDWLANWSLKNGFWTMDSSSPEHLRVKIAVDNPSKIRIMEPDSAGMILIDVSCLDQFLLLYPKDYLRNGKPGRLDRDKVEANQKKRDELNALLNAKASGSGHSDNI